MKKITSFKELSLPGPLAKALEKMNFKVPTPVQAASLPPALAGIDVLGTAQTGTGKTAAFGIPLLAMLLRYPGLKAVVLAPTRELAAQIHQVLARMCAGSKLKGAVLVGGESFLDQKLQVKAGADYFVCTPGRLLDHIEAGLKLTKVGVLVLDEVDRMLDMGFAPQLSQIAPHIPQERLTLLFSATLPKEILEVAAEYLREPVRVSIGATTRPVENVKQENYPTTHLQKNDLLLKHLSEQKGRIMIFTRTQLRANKVYQVLQRNRIKSVIFHGGRTQSQRKQALLDFTSGTNPIMVATDLAGRGIDVSDISCVINYDLPMNREDYIHRIGRTARNGKTGRALNYLVPENRQGRGIIDNDSFKPNQATRANKPGALKGGWESPGGRHRPAFHKRSAREGYTNEAIVVERKAQGKPAIIPGVKKKRRMGDMRAKQAARKLGLPAPSEK